MKMFRGVAAAMAAASMLLGAPGCFLFGSSHHGDEDGAGSLDASIEHGELCAAPASGGAFCVPWAEGPSAAWNKASVAGLAPIEMWAERPAQVSLDALVSRPDRLRGWFADGDAALSYVREVQANAESQRASLGGTLRARLAEAKARQAEIMMRPPVDAVANVKKALGDKATNAKGAVTARLAADKMSLAAVEAVLDKTKSAAVPLEASYAGIVTDFAAYRATEAADAGHYASLATQASQATLMALLDVEQGVTTAAMAASKAPGNLTLRAMTLAAEIEQLEVSSGAALAPYASVPEAHAAPLPDVTSAALRSLNAMLGYIQQRVARSHRAALALLEGIALRRQALALLPQGSALRDSVVQAKLAAASKRFAALSGARLDALTAGPPRSPTLKLPLLARRYDHLISILLLAPLCEASSASWREAGCAVLRPRFAVFRVERETTLPAQLKAFLAILRGRGMDAALLDAAQAALTRGDVKGAALAYDAAVMIAEGT
jgi:hypothetical protein